MNPHPNWAALNDLADGVLDAPAREEVTAHIGECATCHASYSRLRSLLASAERSSAIEAPAAGWEGVRRAMERERNVTAAVRVEREPSAEREGRGRATLRRGLLPMAAAAILVVAATALVTSVALRGKAAVPAPNVTAAASKRDALAGDIERNYLATIDELNSVIAAPRSRLAPETGAAVTKNIAIIDAAIQEVRAALVREPASALLRGILAKNYQQKIELLRRAAERAAAN